MKSTFKKAILTSSVLCCSLLNVQAVQAKPYDFSNFLNDIKQKFEQFSASNPPFHWHLPKRKSDVRDEVFYFVLPDRFYNGNPGNDTSIDSKFSEDGFDPTNRKYYHGGDLDGVRKQLSYLQGMGITSIWLTPVFENQPVQGSGETASAGYHGYWITDYTNVDAHLGGNAALERLVKAAHRRGMKVYLDVVLNHTADVIAYDECHNADGTLLDGLSNCAYRTIEESLTNAYTPFIPAGKEEYKTPSWLNDPSMYHNQGDSSFSGENSLNGDFYGLDDLNTEDPRVVDGMIELSKLWIDKFNIDGLRVDTVKHVGMEFWQQWSPAVQKYAASVGKEDFFIFGEVFSGNAYETSTYTTTGKLQSVLDFGLYYPTMRGVTQPSNNTDFSYIFGLDDLYTDADSDASTLMNFVSNHDVGRIGHHINTSNPTATDEEKLARTKLAHAIMYFARGIPVIYFGDEQGFTGQGDGEGSRQDMMPSLVAEYNADSLIGTDATTADNNFDRRHPLYKTFKNYSHIYKYHKALRRGVQVERFVEEGNGIYAMSRVDPDTNREYLVAFNTATTEKEFTIAGTSKAYDSIWPNRPLSYVKTDLQGNLNVTVPALGFVIYKARTAMPVVEEKLQLSFASPINGAIVNGQVELKVTVSSDVEQVLPLYDVSFEVKVDDGEWTSLGTDKNPDYRVFWDSSNIEYGTTAEVRATATNKAGQSVSIVQSLTIDTVEGLTLFFKKPANWTEASAYWYDSSIAAPAWPGLPMLAAGDDWYRVALPEGVSSATVIFNNGGNGAQTDSLPRNSDGCYDYDNASWSDNCAAPMTVYFQKPEAWADDIHVHHWGESNTDWPGNAAENRGEGWFAYTFPAGINASDLIFNDNNGNQTANLYREGAGCFVADSWIDYCEVPTGVESDNGPLAELVFLRGGMNGWGAIDQFEYLGNGTYEVIMLINNETGAPVTHEFKVADSAWSAGTNFGGNGDAIVWGEAFPLYDGSSNNFSLTVATTGYFKFSIDANNEESVPLMTITPLGPYQVPLYVRGGMNGWGTDNPLTYQEDGSYQFSLTQGALLTEPLLTVTY
ncbi:alpha-amylase family glycosyl hydrolase [Psychromonas sp. MME2]|uniref:alpha-amylase family glycosyl hydrolase n=1 Tax=unclassified Psychromonas TaxID=2614957 RepID=UPI00339BE6FB